MGSVGNTVSYCCIWKEGGRVLYTYKNGDHEIASLASSCLEMTPPYHRWYFQTTGKYTFGFLIDNGYVYFAIVYASLGSSHVLRFLQKLRDEFRRIDKTAGSTKTLSSLDLLCLQEQLFPVVLRLVASLEQHAKEEEEWPNNNSSNGNSTHVDDGVASPTKAPLLGKPSKQDKKKMKDDHVVVAIEMEEHRRSTDRGIKIDHGASSSSQSTRINKHSSQNLHKWCRRVWIVLAIDAVVCVILLIIWLVVCHGAECLR